MESSCNVGEWNRVIAKLTRGREIADQLRAVLSETRKDGASVFKVGGLVEKILDSFKESITILNAGGESDEVSQVTVSRCRKSKDSGETYRKPAAPKDRRGSYKRRKTVETWSKETSNLMEDEHTWRKYGQKVILHAKHPRNYFRCTHKFDQGCLATKQVQKIQDNPTQFRTTYHGRHTCKNLLFQSSVHHIVMDPHSSIIWNFKSAVIDPAMKQEEKEIKPQLSHSQNNDYFVSIDELKTFDASIAGFSSRGSYHGDAISNSDIYSCTASTNSIDVDMIDFDDLPDL